MTEPMIDHLADVWQDIAGIGADLSADEWRLPTECPGWSVHDNVAHMIGTERMLLGEEPARGPRETRHMSATTSGRRTKPGSPPTVTGLDPIS